MATKIFSSRIFYSKIFTANHTSFIRSFTTSTSFYNKVRVLYDGECPLCVKEIRFIKWMDSKKQNINFVDISKDYKAEHNKDIPIEEAMSVMHVIGKDGEIYTRVEAMHKMYDAVGLQWLWTWTKISGISSVVDKLYSWFAKNRLSLTGREWCETGRCTVKKRKT